MKQYRIREVNGFFYPEYSTTSNGWALLGNGYRTIQEAQAEIDSNEKKSSAPLNEVIHEYKPNSKKEILLG